MPWLEKTLYIVLIYLVVINVVTFFIYGIDKWKAKRPNGVSRNRPCYGGLC